jgi:hypothetical protein
MAADTADWNTSLPLSKGNSWLCAGAVEQWRECACSAAGGNQRARIDGQAKPVTAYAVWQEWRACVSEEGLCGAVEKQDVTIESHVQRTLVRRKVLMCTVLQMYGELTFEAFLQLPD